MAGRPLGRPLRLVVHEPRTTRTRVIKDVLITQFLPKNSLTYNKRDDKISKCRNESIASKLQDVRSEVS